MDAMMADCEFTIPYLDDRLNESESREQRVERVKYVFERLRIVENWEVSLPELKYLVQNIDRNGRQIIDRNGRRPDRPVERKSN